MARENKTPMATLERLATCLRYLNTISDGTIETLSSSDIEKATGINAAQFRKDLSHFGEFGRPGIGYNVRELHKRIAKILKVDVEQPVILIGAGNLGSALMGYAGLRHNKFNIVAAFDNSPDKIESKLWDIAVHDVKDLKDVNRSLGAKIAIVTVPASQAQNVTDRLVDAGIRVILNFAPAALRVPDGIVVRNVCFIQELTVLSFHLAGEMPNGTN